MTQHDALHALSLPRKEKIPQRKRTAEQGATEAEAKNRRRIAK